jgi:hypothetical protein
MKKTFTTLVAGVLVVAATLSFGQQVRSPLQTKNSPFDQPDTRIVTNMYWKAMAGRNMATLNPAFPVPPANYTGSGIRSYSSITDDSPDVPVAPSNSTQSENSVFVNPNDELNIFTSHNSSANPMTEFYGASTLYSFDGGQTFEGSVQGAGGSNSGDPVALIGNNGWYYNNYITNSYGQGLSISTDQGQTWTPYFVASGGGGLLDKNHMWIDNSLGSPYEGNLYCAWTDFSGGSMDSRIGFNYSADGGFTWSTPVNVSAAVNSGSHDQGVNIATGPNGEVYVVWAIYDGWPTNETALGLAVSMDGGVTFPPATRIITNIDGIRNYDIGKNMRHNSFPSMAVDQSTGTVYIVWANHGVPGINSGFDVDVYMIRSDDQGATWSAPIRVNQDPIGQGRMHYFPWITCDPDNGILSVIFYDDRNVGGTECETFCANSFDGGDTWEDFKVSDVSFTPAPIGGLADGYMGDYIGINAKGGWVYPTWADTRTGSVMTYVSAYQTNPLARPKNLTASVEFETGIASLDWSFTLPMEGFEYFNVYRDDILIGTATDTAYSDQLPDYGIYEYSVTAYYTVDGESSSARTTVQWGDAQISYAPDAITETLQPDSMRTVYVTVSNIGQLEMDYNISTFIPGDGGRETMAYCTGGGGCDEYISRVQFGDIDNSSTCTQYGNYTNLSTTISVGNTYPMIVTNGNPIYPADYLAIWIDWNQDEVFDDSESVGDPIPGVGPYYADVVPPLGAKTGTTRMRIRMTWSEIPVPCGYTVYGEVEDYSVNVLSWLNIEPTLGSILPGESATLAVILDATGMEVGTYYADIQIFSNDPDNPEVVIPLTLIVSEMSVQATASSEVICLGEAVQLNAEASGGSGTYTYSWTSMPEGFVSDIAGPEVTPEFTTTYYVEISDGTLTANDMVTVTVNPLPELSLGDDQVTCTGDTITLDAGVHTSYLWSTGDTTAQIKVTETGDYFVQVSNEFSCAASDTVNVLFNLFPGPTAVSGPVIVDNFMNASTVYDAAASSDADSYVWTITPTEAGTTASTGASAEFVWNAGFTGNAEITVYGVNECGDGEISAAYTIQLFSSQGIGEGPNGQFRIYPNPSDGKFVVKFDNQQEFKAEVRVTTLKGEIVYRQADMVIAPQAQLELDLRTLTRGYYNLQVITRDGKAEAPIIITN